MTPRHKAWLLAATVMLAGTLVTLVEPPAPHLIWNVSDSAPRGLYLVTPGAALIRGVIGIALLPTRLRDLASRRRYLPANVPLVKHVAAIGGDRVCAHGATIAINGRILAHRLKSDPHKRALPWWRGCTVLKPGDLFLLGDRPDSFDGRYFGVTDKRDVMGKGRLLWPR